MKTTPHLITEANLSVAWARAFLHVVDGAKEALVVALRDFGGGLPDEDRSVAETLDAELLARDIPRVDHTALTIVPYARWLREGKMAFCDLRKWYLESLLPRLKARCSKNRRGTYFERFVAFTGIRQKGGAEKRSEVDQIGNIIRYWKRKEANAGGGRPRQSALQLACFDPAKDHTGSALAGFPCLQQVSFTYHEKGSLEVTAYYPTQYVFDRGYGNYLGLCQLGHVVAHELGVKLTRFTCFTARPELSGKPPRQEFVEQMRDYVNANRSESE